MRSPASLYDTDFLLWLEQQSAALKAGRWQDLDVPNLVEEIDALAGSLRRELRRRVRVLLQHLLKLEYQPAKASGSWRATVRDQRDEIELPPDTFPRDCPFSLDDILATD